jgi:hypothetical protein
MKLARLIHDALVNPELRSALETGSLHVSGSNPFELEAAAEVMRYSRRVATPGGPLREPRQSRGMIGGPDGWTWKE